MKNILGITAVRKLTFDTKLIKKTDIRRLGARRGMAPKYDLMY